MYRTNKNKHASSLTVSIEILKFWLTHTKLSNSSVDYLKSLLKLIKLLKTDSNKVTLEDVKFVLPYLK